MSELDERYVISPKGCAWLALHNVGLIDEGDEGRFDAFWILFDKYMVDAGYVTTD